MVEAGCKEKKWNDTEDELPSEDDFEWGPPEESALLTTGVCVLDQYKKHLVPVPGQTTVYSTISHQVIREVDSRQKTVSVDFTLTMRWYDPNIKAKFTDNELEFLLTPTATESIWQPDMVIHNMTTFRAKEEWASLISAKVKKQPKTNVEMQYDLKATVYCHFEYSEYPMDTQNCNINIGSSSLAFKFALASTNAENDSETNVASNFRGKTTVFDNNRSTESNTIGIKLDLSRIITPFLWKYYIPTTAIVLVSTISFVIPLTSVPGRVALLVTLFLTLINLFIYEMVSIDKFEK